MMKEEFEQLSGYEVSRDDYDFILEPMYMATHLTKSEFVKVIDKKRFALKSQKQIINQIKKLASQLKQTCTHYTDDSKIDEIEELVAELNKRFYGYWRLEEDMIWTCYYPKRLIHDGKAIVLVED